RQIVIEPMPPASERARELGAAHLLPPGFDAWFARATARDPGARFHDAAEAHAALAPLLGGPGLGSAEVVAPARGAADMATPSTPAHVSVRPAPTPFEINTTMAPSMSSAAVSQPVSQARAPKRSAALYVV